MKRLLPLALLLALPLAAQPQLLNSFEAAPLQGWQSKDNVKLAVTNSQDATRKGALRCAAVFEKFTYAWIRKLDLKAGAFSLEKAGGIMFWARVEAPAALAVHLTWVDENKKEIRHAASVAVTDKWQQYTVPYAAFKKEPGGTALGAEEAGKITWLTFTLGKKEAAQTALWLDDVSFMAK